MICQSHLSPSPGGYRLVVLSDEVNAFMERCDAGEAVEPTTFVLEPYVVHERKKFVHHMARTVKRGRVSGYAVKSYPRRQHRGIGEFLFKQVYKRFKEVVKITHEDKVIWQR